MQDCVGPALRPGRAAQGRSFMQPKYEYRRRLPHIQKDKSANFHHFHYRPPLETSC